MGVISANFKLDWKGKNPGGGAAIYGLYRYVRCEGYVFQAVYSVIGYINRRVKV